MTGRPRYHLERLGERLSDRDWLILGSLAERRYLTTRQLARQFFGVKKNGPVPRHTNHALHRLRDLGLLVNLLRRVGGVRAGSAGHVWSLTETGSRLLAQHDGRPQPKRVREYEPAPATLEHTLAIAEIVLDLYDAGVEVKTVEFEPTSWRKHLGGHGVVQTLKPDLAVTTESDGYLDAWFIEVDRATEPPGRVVRKCQSYLDYQHTGAEQKQLGVFPAVVWVVPGDARKRQLRDRIDSEPKLDARLFVVITPDELGDLFRLGAANYQRNSGGQKGGNST